jgi:membrane protease YdiL (CAAX protease family)
LKKKLDKQLLTITTLAVFLFIPLFIFKQIGPLDFWWWMTANLIILIGLSFITDWEYPYLLQKDFSSKVLQKTGVGLLSALILYLVFFAGNYLSRLWFDFAGSGIEGVYGFKGDAPGIRIAVLMLLIIGPGEEIFWRGYLQRKLSNKFGRWTGLFLALLLYTGVHVFTGNIMLILAAFICGLFWGWLYMKHNSMLINVISHTVWDIVVFLVLPFNI